MCFRRLENFLQHLENQRFQIFLNFLTFPLEMLHNHSVAFLKEMYGSPKNFESVDFQSAVKIFLDVEDKCSGYLEGVPRSRLSSAPTFKVIQRITRKEKQITFMFYNYFLCIQTIRLFGSNLCM